MNQIIPHLLFRKQQVVSSKRIFLADVLEIFQFERSMLAFEFQIDPFGFGHEFKHEVKNMKVSFGGGLTDDAAFFTKSNF
jgi:hypothetical protein